MFYLEAPNLVIGHDAQKNNDFQDFNAKFIKMKILASDPSLVKCCIKEYLCCKGCRSLGVLMSMLGPKSIQP